jgi:hypothetical protein
MPVVRRARVAETNVKTNRFRSICGLIASRQPSTNGDVVVGEQGKGRKRERSRRRLGQAFERVCAVVY